MRFVHAELGLDMILQEGTVGVLTVESPRLFTSVLQELYDQMNGENGGFVMSQEEKILPLEKNSCLVTDVFSLDMNDKKIITKLHSRITETAVDLYEEKETINSEIVALLDRAVSFLLIDNVVFNDMLDWTSLLKLYGVKLANTFDSMSEKLNDYIKVCALLCGYKVLFLVNLKCYLSADDLRKLYKMAEYYKIWLVLIEATERERLHSELHWIIDSDGCIIDMN